MTLLFGTFSIVYFGDMVSQIEKPFVKMQKALYVSMQHIFLMNRKSFWTLYWNFVNVFQSYLCWCSSGNGFQNTASFKILCTICECIRTYHSKSSPVVWSHAITVTSSEYVLLKTPQRTTVTITMRRG